MENKLFIERTFKTYGDALDWYLETEFGHGANKKIAKELIRRSNVEKKLGSLAAQIGQWRNNTRSPQPHNIKLLNSVLNVRIEEAGLNEWVIKRTNKEKPQDEQSNSEVDELTTQARQLVRLLRSDKSGEPLSDDRIRGLELAELLIRLVKESLKKESPDQS